MANKLPSKKYDQSKYSGFIKVAQSFKNAAGVLIIHSAIAFADSISINFSSLKIKGDSHYDVIYLFNQVIPHELKNPSALDHFKKLIDHKNAVSYSGDVYTKSDIIKMQKHFERYYAWVTSLLNL